MKLLLVGAFGALAALVVLASTFGYDMSPQGILELLAKTLNGMLNFFAKLLEGLLP